MHNRRTTAPTDSTGAFAKALVCLSPAGRRARSGQSPAGPRLRGGRKAALTRPFGIPALLAAAALCLVLAGCGGGGGGTAGGGTSAADEGTTSGPAYTEPTSVPVAAFDAAAATGSNGALIDASQTAKGFVGASATSSSRLKFQVIKGDVSYNYDLPSDGTPIICPINMGDGAYTFRVMQNTSGSNYAAIATTDAAVTLENQFVPFLNPTLFCEFTNSSPSVQKARELAANAQNEGDVVRAVYEWIATNVTYDKAKASQLADGTGYVPDPDSTLSSTTGICFDYASLAAAMFRSLGIPCQIITGYVSPDNVYHAWNMIYIDGSWVSAQISVDPDKWTRIDLTFAASDGGNTSTIGDGTSYTDRYVY